MKHINDVINTIKHLDPNRISINNQGKLMIKIDDEQSSLAKPLSIPGQYKNNIMHSILLHPEDRLARKNLNLWLQELINSVTHLSFDHEVDFQLLATLFNLAGLVFTHLGKFALAERLCRKQINYFIQQSKYDFSVLKYIIQPWINLGRLDRIRGDYNAAQEKISILQTLMQDSFLDKVDIFDCNVNYLLQAIETDRQLQDVIKTCIIVEPIKTYLTAKSYFDLKDFYQIHLREPAIKHLHGFIYEAAIITLTHLGLYEQAILLCEEAINVLPPHVLHIFLLRQAELYATVRDNQANLLFTRLLRLLDYLEKDAIDNNKALFAIKLAQQMQQCNLPQLAYKSYINALYFGKLLSDECLMIDALTGLITLGNEKDFKSWYDELISQSGYVCIQNKLKQNMIQPKVRQQLELKSKKLFNQLMVI